MIQLFQTNRSDGKLISDSWFPNFSSSTFQHMNFWYSSFPSCVSFVTASKRSDIKPVFWQYYILQGAPGWTDFLSRSWQTSANHSPAVPKWLLLPGQGGSYFPLFFHPFFINSAGFFSLSSFIWFLHFQTSDCAAFYSFPPFQADGARERAAKKKEAKEALFCQTGLLSDVNREGRNVWQLTLRLFPPFLF